MGVVPFKKTLSADENATWAWDAATQNAILNADGHEENSDNWALYKQAHTWFDSERDDVKAGFKLPHHRLAASGDELEAVWAGVKAAMSRLEQSDIPEGDLKGAFDHLIKHYAQWDKEPPEWDRWIADVRERKQRAQQREAARDVALFRSRLQTPAVISSSSLTSSRTAALPLVATRAPISVTAARPGGAPTDDDLTRINALARSPLTAEQVYVFPAEISNQSVDAYYTRMTAKSLNQFAQDATRGVAVCDSHQHYQLPIGRSFYGVVATDPTGTSGVIAADGATAAAGGVMSTQSLAYMLRGMRTPSGMSTDDIIRGIEGGVNADVSIGFIPDAYWCSICHMDMLATWDCMHWPGQTYEIKDPDTGVVSTVVCIADVDASLAEYSLVYDGATPNAMVLKGEAALDAGRMTPEIARQIRLVEDHCRVKLIDRWRGFGSGLGDGQMNDQWSVPPASTASQSANASAAPANNDKEYDDMRGSEFISRYLETVKAEATRVGKQVSQKNLDRLTALHDKLSGGHDTMDEAMRELASFIDDVSSGAGGDTDGDGDNPAGGDDPDGDGRASAAAAVVAAAGEPQVRSVEIRADGSHDAFTGTHTHSHSAYASQGGDVTHEHEHTHDGDANHEHVHAENATFGVELRTAPATGVPNQGIEMAAADGQVRVATLEPVTAGNILATADGMSEEQRAIFELGQRVLREAQDAAIQWAVRAGIVSTPEDEQRYRAMFARCSFDEVTTFRQSWEQIAKSTLSPRGRWTPDRSAPGGGRWDDTPTLTGGRQTQAGDPNDPQRLAATARTLGPAHVSTPLRSHGRQGDDAALYTVGASSKRRKR